MLHEKSRVYYFEAKDGFREIEVTNVRELLVSKSGGHRLTKSDGYLVYIPTGWLAIKIHSNFGWEQ